MIKVVKAVIFGGKARVAVIDVKEAVNELISIHQLSPLSAAAIGRAVAMGAYISSNLKNKTDKFNLIIDGKGPLGKIYVAGNSGSVKAFVENPSYFSLNGEGKLDIAGAVGKDGNLIVIKDLGLKDPYVGQCKLVSGAIGEDFAEYLYKSEGVSAAVVTGELQDQTGCLAAGGIVVEALPSADDNAVFILEDIVSLTSDIGALLKEKSAEEIARFYFGHLDSSIFETINIDLRCNCSEKIMHTVMGLGKEEATDIIKTQGILELHCDYCSKYYRFDQHDIDKIFGEQGGKSL